MNAVPFAFPTEKGDGDGFKVEEMLCETWFALVPWCPGAFMCVVCNVVCWVCHGVCLGVVCLHRVPSCAVPCVVCNVVCRAVK